MWLIFIVIYSLIWFGAGVFYKGRKITPLIAILKDPALSSEEKIKKILDLLI
jgi:hypothetical protein